MVPPHLPAPSSHIATHQRWLRLKLIFFVSSMGLFAGITGSFMVLGWIWPNFVQDYSGGVSFTRSSQNQSQLSDRLKQELNERIMTVYQTSAYLGTLNYLPSTARRTEAIVVSSDGWIVFYDPTIDRTIKNWRIVGFDGTVYGVNDLVVDSHTGINYAHLKMNGENTNHQEFKVANFAAEVKPLDELFVYQREGWYHTIVEFPLTQVLSDSYLDSAPNTFYSLAENFSSGAFVANLQGEISGIMRDGKVMALASDFTRALPSVLNKHQASYPSLGIEGSYSTDQPVVTGGVTQAGFLVGKVIVPSQLHRGDLLTEINGQVVTAATLWHTISNRPVTVRVKVLRNNKLLELVVPVVEL